jgi:hypothetical protein
MLYKKAGNMEKETVQQNVHSGLSRENPYQYYKGIHVLHISGNDYQMGFQHGKILKEAISRGSLPYFAKYVENILKGIAGKYPGKMIGSSLQATVGRTIANSMPMNVLEAFEGLADGAGLSRKELISAVVMPETFLWLSSRLLQIRNLPKAPRFKVPLMGCSSVAAWGKATVNGELLHGRNLDYQGMGAWDKETAVVFHEPINSQKYASVSSAGILLGGITAMNESGLTLAVHQHIASDSFKLGGLPVGIIGDRVMREAHNINEAIDILNSHIPIGCWTYIVSSGKEKKVLCYEVTPEDRAWFISEDEIFGYSNIFLDKKLADTEYFLYPSQWRSNTDRYHCIYDRLNKNKGSIDENTIASILGERNNEQCRLHAPLAMPLTVGSTVFNPSSGIFYVGAGKTPTSNRPFVAFDLNKLSPAYQLNDLTGGIPASEKEIYAFDKYCESYTDFENEQVDMALMKIEKAIRAQPGEALYHYMAGLIAVSSKEFNAAIDSFSQAILLGHPSVERIAAFHLWRARCYDMLNQRHNAIEDYKRVGAGDPAVIKAGEKGLKSKWKWKKPNIEFNYADVMSP